jgi:thiosulfate/3-mercaptopyruvate sulfurtransferase
MDNLVSSAWLQRNLGRDVVVLDASWHLPAMQRDAKADFTACRIPGAQFFDIDDISDQKSCLPHMLPSAAEFSQKVAALGAGDGKRIVCYDTTGLFSAARAWWMFKTFGHDEVAVLDGSLKAWLGENRATENGPPRQVVNAHFTAVLKSHLVRAIHQLDNVQIVDARSPTRFRGEEAEPRPGVLPGHIPETTNVHYASVLNSDGTMKQPQELRSLFEKSGIDIQNQIVTSCGSGITAAIVLLALERAGATQLALYDGSWAEWGASGREIATG